MRIHQLFTVPGLLALGRRLKYPTLFAFLFALAGGKMFGGFLHVSALEVEEGTYFPGDPVPMLIEITSTHPTESACFEVFIHLTPDGNFRTLTDHVLERFSGGIGPGESVQIPWVQHIPGNLPGSFFVDAEVTTCENSQPAMSNPSSTLASAFIVQTAKITIMPSEFPETELLSRTVDRRQGNEISQQPSVSADGRFVAFASDSTSFLTQIQDDDDDEETSVAFSFQNIFVKDHWTGELELVTAPFAGPTIDASAYQPRISADGRWVVFHTNARNLMPGVINPNNNVYLWNREQDELTLVSISENEDQANQASQNASVSGDGRYTVFESEATNLLPGDTNNVADIFLYDHVDGSLTRVNVTNDGSQALGGHSRNPRISVDGRQIVYESRATNLAAPTTGVWEIYVFNRDTQKTSRLSRRDGADGSLILSDGHSRHADLSDNGRFVVFHSEATNLYADPAEGAIVLTGRPATGTVRFEESDVGTGTITFGGETSATGTIAFDGNPSDGNTLGVSDGVNFKTFEFDSNIPASIQPGNVRVAIGGSTSTTRNNLETAINAAFVINGEQTIRAERTSIDGRPGLLLTNVAQGLAGNNQPIDNGNAPTLSVTGMGTAPENTASTTLPQAGDTLEIDTGRNAPVTLSFFAQGSSDPTDHGARILGVEIGRTGAETAQNMLSVFHALGYQDYDIPQLPEFLLSPPLVNPEPGDGFLFTHNGIERNFFFVASPLDFDPSNPANVSIGATPAETRGNLLRSIAHFFDFQPLPAVFESDGTPVAIGDSFVDLQARGAVALRILPEPGYRITIGDGLRTVTFRFEDLREPVEGEEEEDIPPFEDLGNGTIVIYIVEDNRGATEQRLFAAIQSSMLDITASMGMSEELERLAILLLNNQVGDIGNVAITISPVPPEPEGDEEPEQPYALTVGMQGGALGRPADGARIVFYPENLLHPSVVFEFQSDRTNVSEDAFFVPLGSTGAETEGNFLVAVIESGLPWLTAGRAEGEFPGIQFESLVPTGDGSVVFNFSPSNPAAFVSLTSQAGMVRTPAEGGTLTLSDGFGGTATFEFTADGSVEPGNIPVSISPVAEANRDNFIDAINSQNSVNIVAENGSDDDDIQVLLTNVVPGPEGNQPIITTDVGPFVSVSGMSGGQENPSSGEAFVIADGIGDPVTFEFIQAGGNVSEAGRQPIIIGADRLETRDNIIAAIKESGLRIFAIPSMEGGIPAVSLTHMVPGPSGNQAIIVLTENPSFEIRGMSGGGSLGTGAEQIYVVDRDANDNGVFDESGQVSIDIVSVNELGAPANGLSLEPAISGDGRYVGFRTLATNLQPFTITRSDGEVFPNLADGGLTDRISSFTDGDAFSDIYVRDLQEGENRRVSVNRFGEGIVGGTIAANFPRSSRGVDLNHDGRYIVFETDDQSYSAGHSPGLVGDGQVRGGGMAHTITNRNTLDNNTRRDIMIHDRRFPTEVPPIPSGLPPEIAILSPAPGVSVSSGSSLLFSARASDADGTVERVTFYVNGMRLGNAEKQHDSDLWVLLAPMPLYGSGTFSVGAVAADNVGNLAHAVGQTITVVPSAGPAAPQPTLSVTPSVLHRGQPAILSLQPAASGATLVSAQFYANGQLIGAAGPGALSLTWVPPSDGTFTLMAIAVDANGNSIPSNPTEIVVQGNEGPQVTWVRPVPGEESTIGQPVELIVQATDTDGSVVTVEFLVNGQSIGLGQRVGITNRYRLLWMPIEQRLYEIQARVTDDTGLVGISNVRVVDTRIGDVTDPANASGFVTQMFLDILNRTPTASEFDSFVKGLRDGSITRVQLVQALLNHPEFVITEWIIAAYLTILGEPPTVVELEEAYLSLVLPPDDGDDGDDGDGDDGDDNGAPVGLRALVSNILTSTRFFLKYDQYAVDMDADDLFDIIWDNTGRSKPTFAQRQLYVGRIEADPLGAIAAMVDPDRFGARIRNAALVLLLLERDTSNAEIAHIGKQSNPIEYVLTRSEFADRFRANGNPFGAQPSDSPERVSPWFGRFNDTYFNYSAGVGSIKHEEHEWLFGSVTENGIWLWDYIQKDWLWTNEEEYPFFYSDNRQEWLYYKKGGTPAERQFYSYRPGAGWFSVTK